MKQLYCLIFILISCFSDVQAEYDADYPDVLEPRRFTFQYISEDSINKLKENIIEELGGDGIGERAGYEELFLLSVGDEIHIAMYNGEEWQISTGSFSKSWGTSFSFSVVNLDGIGRYEILVQTYNTNGRGGRYSGYDNRTETFYLVNVDKEYKIYLRENYYNEYHSYVGYTAGDSDTGDYDREDEEMQNDDNWEFGEDANDCEIRVTSGSLFFESINCTDCDDFSDSIFAVEYVLRNDTLVKNKLMPYYTNISHPFGYKVLRGEVGRRSVVMHLTKVDKFYTGYYYDDKKHKYVELLDNSQYKNTEAAIVLKERSGDNYFYGEILDSRFIGKYISGKKEKSFKLEEDYSNGATKLTAYSFSDSVMGDNSNRYDISVSYYLADTAAMSKADAVKINDALLDRRGYEGRVLVSDPHAVFYDYRSVMLSDLFHEALKFDEIFKDKEDAKFYSSLNYTLYYNQNNLMSFVFHESTYTGGARVGHSIGTINYDVKTDMILGPRKILTCTDSALRSVIEEVYYEVNNDSLSKHINMFDKYHTGQMYIRQDGLCFYFEQYPFTETVFIPYEKLKKYIRPEYLERLMD